MKVTGWTAEQRLAYWKSQQNEDAYKQTLVDEHEDGFKEGQLIGKIKGEIKQVKSLLTYNVSKEDVMQEFKFLKKKEENIKYIQDHQDETETQIMEKMDIEDIPSQQQMMGDQQQE